MNKFFKTIMSTAVTAAVALSATVAFAYETDGETYWFEDFNTGWNIAAGESTNTGSGYLGDWAATSGSQVSVVHGGSDNDGFYGFSVDTKNNSAYRTPIVSGKMLDGFDWKNFNGKLVLSYDMYFPTLEDMKAAGLTGGVTSFNSPRLSFHYKDNAGTPQTFYVGSMPPVYYATTNFSNGGFAADIYTRTSHYSSSDTGNEPAPTDPITTGSYGGGQYMTIGDKAGYWVPVTLMMEKQQQGKWSVKHFIGNDFISAKAYGYDIETEKKNTDFSAWRGGSWFWIINDFLKDVDDPTGYFTFDMYSMTWGMNCGIDNFSLRIYDTPTLQSVAEVKEGDSTVDIKVFNSGVDYTASEGARAGYLLLSTMNGSSKISVLEYEPDDLYFENGKSVSYGVSVNLDNIATKTDNVASGFPTKDSEKINDGSILRLNLATEITKGLAEGKRYKVVVDDARDMLTSTYNTFNKSNTYKKAIGTIMTEDNSTLLWMGTAPKFTSISFTDIYGDRLSSKSDYYKANKITLSTLDTTEKTYSVYRGEKLLTTTQSFVNGVYEFTLPDYKILGGNNKLKITCGSDTIVEMQLPDATEAEFTAVEADGNYPYTWYVNPTDKESQVYLVASYKDESGKPTGETLVCGPYTVLAYTNAKISGNKSLGSDKKYDLALFDGFKLEKLSQNTAAISNLLVNGDTLKSSPKFRFGTDNADLAANIAVFEGDWSKSKPTADADAIAAMKYAGTVTVDKYGSADVTYDFTNFASGKMYTIAAYVGTNAYYNTFSVVTTGDAETKVEEINDKTAEDIFDFVSDEENKIKLQLNSATYDSLDDKESAAKLMTTYGDFDNAEDVAKAFNECAAIQAFNEGKVDDISDVMSDVAILQGTSFGGWLELNDDVSTDRTESWKEDVTERMNASDSASLSQFNTNLYTSVAYAVVSNPESVDSLHDFLKDNAADLGLDSQYITAETCQKVSGTTYSGYDISALKNDLKSYYEEYNYEDDDDSGNGSGKTNGGGSGKVNVSVDGNVVPGVTAPTGTTYVIFGDIEGYDWANTAITELYKKKIINGKADGMFAPADNVTREEFTKMIVSILGLSTDDARGAFEDVSSDDWFAAFVKAAVDNGIISGQSDVKFGVGENITRQDMAVILYNTLKYLNITLEEENTSFADIDDVSDYAVEAVSKLSAAKIINGYEDGSFKPLNPATRAEAAKLIYTFVIAYGL